MEGLNLHLMNATIGSDVEYRTFENSDNVVASFSVATNRTYHDKSGEKQTETQWHKVECWNKLAKFADKHLKKGKNIFIQGEVRTDKSEKDGVTRYFTKTLANRITFLPSKSDFSNASPSDAQAQVADMKDNAPQGQTTSVDQGAFKGDDEDLPF